MKRIVKVFWKDPQDRRIEVNYEAERLSDDLETWRDGSHVMYFHKEYCMAVYDLHYADGVIPMTYFFSETYENCYVQDHNVAMDRDGISRIRAMIDQSLSRLILSD